eukprot:Plantae.Rhodophyta-Rhodochaete_pulchella.ctg15851.p2 GENE.Plantae.Rhodophyta-Rhodochaete_pulchella.ctg15851~~Plantae.Rhodophyta-Rhodochaete_pulchella.ctg15851.p2  ORF type:complete len:138 (-),score=24.12 Plantae.Rhodophyta-Rhodochaete_pulchella.ctg15851:380-793(-)
MSAEDYGNSAAVEITWANSAFSFAERHWLLLTHLPADSIRITGSDDEIYDAFRKEFPDFRVDRVSEAEMKSADGKASWRAFLDGFVKERVPDFNFGTLLRLDYSGKYDDDNTTLVTRGQFYAIEIARNRELPHLARH